VSLRVIVHNWILIQCCCGHIVVTLWSHSHNSCDPNKKKKCHFVGAIHFPLLPIQHSFLLRITLHTRHTSRFILHNLLAVGCWSLFLSRDPLYSYLMHFVIIVPHTERESKALRYCTICTSSQITQRIMFELWACNKHNHNRIRGTYY